MERQRDSRPSRTLRAMYPAYPRPGDDPDGTRVVPPGSRPSPLSRPSGPRPTHRLPALARPDMPETDEQSQRTLIVPAQQHRQQRTLARIPTPISAPALEMRRSPIARVSRLITFGAVLIALVTAMSLHIVQATHQPLASSATTTASVPAPSGRGPWSSSSGALVVISDVAPVTKATSNIPGALQPCHDSTMFLPTITQWSVPPGCYGNIYQPNPANYVQRPGFGWCNWWVRVTHPDHPDITESLAYPRGTNPVAGAPIFFDGGEQGADSAGHWAVAVAVSPDHYWVLISEMNFAWRGGGWGKLDYRYIHVSPHVHFVYIYS